MISSALVIIQSDTIVIPAGIRSVHGGAVNRAASAVGCKSCRDAAVSSSKLEKQGPFRGSIQEVEALIHGECNGVVHQ